MAGREKSTGGRGQREGGRGERDGSKGKENAAATKQGADIDALFQLPLPAFTAARNDRAAKYKKAGRAADAERVRAIAKPSVPAWAVNQLYWRHRKAFDHLLAMGDRFRQAQAATLAGKTADIRTPLDERRAALSMLGELAATLLREAGHEPAPALMRRVTTTLEALATYGTQPSAGRSANADANHADDPDVQRAGRLVTEVDPPGFEALAALVPRVGQARSTDQPPSRVLTFRQQKRPSSRKKVSKDPQQAARDRAAEHRALLMSAKAEIVAAERALRDARKAAGLAERALKTAAARAKEAEKARADAEALHEKASAAADAGRQEARRIATEAEAAAQAEQDAERAVEKARSALQELAQVDK